MRVAEVVDDSCEDCELDSVVTVWLLVLDVALEVLPLALTDPKIPALALALVPLVVVTVCATLMPALLEVLWKAAALVWLVVFSTLASKGLTAPVLLLRGASITSRFAGYIQGGEAGVKSREETLAVRLRQETLCF